MFLTIKPVAENISDKIDGSEQHNQFKPPTVVNQGAGGFGTELGFHQSGDGHDQGKQHKQHGHGGGGNQQVIHFFQHGFKSLNCAVKLGVFPETGAKKTAPFGAVFYIEKDEDAVY